MMHEIGDFNDVQILGSIDISSAIIENSVGASESMTFVAYDVDNSVL